MPLLSYRGFEVNQNKSLGCEVTDRLNVEIGWVVHWQWFWYCRAIMNAEDHGQFRPQPAAYEYRLGDGWIVLAGRSAADNDLLSLKAAAPNDWWFHVRGMPGSHVILKAGAGRAPSRNILKQAAAIAAYHSKARAGGVVAVSCTQVRFVSKPRGAKPGSVSIRKETVFKVRPTLPGDSGLDNPDV